MKELQSGKTINPKLMRVIEMGNALARKLLPKEATKYIEVLEKTDYASSEEKALLVDTINKYQIEDWELSKQRQNPSIMRWIFIGIFVGIFLGLFYLWCHGGHGGWRMVVVKGFPIGLFLALSPICIQKPTKMKLESGKIKINWPNFLFPTRFWLLLIGCLMVLGPCLEWLLFGKLI